MWSQPQATDDEPQATPQLGGGPGFFADYFWFLLKNLVGWVFVLASFVLGPVPGPGGIVVFLIGFGMISFPGKRRLIVRCFRGRRFDFTGWRVHAASVAAAGALAAGVSWWFIWRPDRAYAELLNPAARAEWEAVYRREHLYTYAVAVLGAWLVVRGGLLFANWLVKIMPKIRRTVRPWLRHRGVDLLPPRLRKRVRQPDGQFAWSHHGSAEGEILRIHERHTTRLSNAWDIARPWLKRLIGVGITVAIFAWMLRPVVREWDRVGERVKAIDWGLFGLAAVMFAAFLFTFRVIAWRKILKGFGYKLPYGPATRIWSTSELARYLPGVIWQVVGRVYLVKPYGVSGTVCSTSQILELVVFLLANVLVAVGCLAWFGTKMDPQVAKYLYASTVLVPLLMLLLHPKVFYTLLTKYMTWRGKQLPTRRVRGKMLTMLTGWAILGLLWQSLALWLITKDPLGLPYQKWWVVAGSYCLAWCAGFVAFWAPGGLGVREFVFVTAMMFALPPWAREKFGDRDVLFGFLAFLGILLRLWTIAGELILTGVAYAADYRGALGKADAPGRAPALTES
jgi:hypothetical protein